MKGGKTNLLGRWGEERVAEWLRGKKYRIVAANWRCRFGEIDLIAEDEKHICFTEVKLRKNDGFAQAREFVDARKQERIKTAAQLYLSQNPTGLQPRFDVAEVYAPEGTATSKPEIHYIINAF